MSLHRNGRSTRSRFRKFGKFLAQLEWISSPLKTTLTAQSFFTKSTDALVCSTPSCSATADIQASQGTMAQACSNSPPLEEPTVVSELFQLLKAASWLIPLRRDLLSQAKGMIWHPWPELFVCLHVWPVDGSLSASQSMS